MSGDEITLKYFSKQLRAQIDALKEGVVVSPEELYSKRKIFWGHIGIGIAIGSSLLGLFALILGLLAVTGGVIWPLVLSAFSVTLGIRLFNLCSFVDPVTHPIVTKYLNEHAEESSVLDNEIRDYSTGVVDVQAVRDYSPRYGELVRKCNERFDELSARVEVILSSLEELVAPIRDKKALKRLSDNIGKMLPEGGVDTQDLTPFVAVFEAKNEVVDSPLGVGHGDDLEEEGEESTPSEQHL